MIDWIFDFYNDADGIGRFLIWYNLVAGTLYLISLILQPSKDTDKIDKKGKYELATSKARFVREVTSWALSNLYYEGTENRKRWVHVDIAYHKNKKFLGFFFSSTKSIRVYVNGHSHVDSLIDTTIHEVVHYLQYLSDIKNHDSRYAALLKEKSYWNHHMEIEARKLAAHYTPYCKKAMLEAGFIRPKR